MVYMPNQNRQRDQKTYLKLLERKMQQNNVRALNFFIVLEPAGIDYGHRNLNSRFLFLIMIFCLTSTNQNNGKLHEEPTNRLCCAKNELTIGLVYTE